MYKKLIPILLILAACGDMTEDKTIVIHENELGIINASVFSDQTNTDQAPQYSMTAPGASEKIERAFENAPPMIPHNTIGFFPITIKNNICLSCHLPSLAEKAGSTPLPETHFQTLRPELELVDGLYQEKKYDTQVVNRMEGENLEGAYYNCSQCHTPQATVTVDIENLFTPEFRNLLNKNKSTLVESLDEGL